jgi:hypothetical protein
VEVQPAPPVEETKEAPASAPAQEGLTEAEQLAFDKFGGDWEGPERFASERQALKYFAILMKGDHASVRWYQHYKFTQTDKAKRRIYGRDIATALAALNPTRNREWLKLVSNVVKKKWDYPETIAGTCKVVGASHNQKAIPLMREALDHPVTFVQIQAAGALLTLGDVDTALPILDGLTKEGKTAALGYVYHNLRGAKWQKRGIELLRKAQGYDDNETRGLATLFLISLKKKGVVKDDPKQLEVVLEKIGEEILDRNKLAAYFSRDSDHRALEIIIRGFEQLRCKDAIPLLQRIAEHPEASYLRQRVNEAIKQLS